MKPRRRTSKRPVKSCHRDSNQLGSRNQANVDRRRSKEREAHTHTHFIRPFQFQLQRETAIGTETDGIIKSHNCEDNTGAMTVLPTSADGDVATELANITADITARTAWVRDMRFPRRVLHEIKILRAQGWCIRFGPTAGRLLLSHQSTGESAAIHVPVNFPHVKPLLRPTRRGPWAPCYKLGTLLSRPCAAASEP